MADISSLSSVQSNHEKYAYLFDDTKGNDMVNTETFFNLLIAEMSNQDPLEPTSNTEFVSQMAQFTALQAQQDNLKYSMSNYASTLVGKTLTVNAQNDDGTLKSGVCTGVSINGSEVNIVVDGKQYSLASVKAIGEAKPEEQAGETDVAKAASFIGKEVIVKVKGDDGEVYYDSGIVDSVEVDDGVAKIVINNYVYDLSEIVMVKQPAEEGTEQDTDSSTDSDDTLQQILDIIEG